MIQAGKDSPLKWLLVAKSHHQCDSYVEKMVMTGMIINGKEVPLACMLLEKLSVLNDSYWKIYLQCTEIAKIVVNKVEDCQRSRWLMAIGVVGGSGAIDGRAKPDRERDLITLPNKGVIRWSSRIFVLGTWQLNSDVTSHRRWYGYDTTLIERITNKRYARAVYMNCTMESVVCKLVAIATNTNYYRRFYSYIHDWIRW